MNHEDGDETIPVSGLEDHVGYWLRYVSNHVSSTFRKRIEATGVTVAEWVALRVLFDLGATRPSVLAQSMGMTRGAVTRLVERLVRKNLIDRSPEERDHRAQTIAITGAGRLLVPRLAEIADTNDAEYFGHLGPEAREGLMTLMREIVRIRALKDVPVD